MGWMILAVDPTLAYLQVHDLNRNVYARLPHELRRMLQGSVMHIIKPV